MPYIAKLIQLCNQVGCICSVDESLKQHTTFKVGGSCKLFIEVSSADAVCEIVSFCNKNHVKYAILGNGSNVIVPDDGFDGVILHFGKNFSKIEMLSNGELRAYSGASLQNVCNKALEESLTGLEFAYGIPGSIGGALLMNAGAYGGEMVDVVTSAEYVTPDGVLKSISVEDMQLSYRHSIFCDLQGCVITSVTIKCSHGDYATIKSKMCELIKARSEKQPLEYPSAGSTFKRPVGNYASKLIDECGLRGFSYGDAQISEKHCGFVINKGNATCNDILKLTDEVISIVREKTGYTLELEPKILK